MDDFVELAPFGTAILRVFVIDAQFARHKVHGHLAVRKSCWFMIWWHSRKSTCQEQTNSSVRNKRIVGQQRGLCKILYFTRLHEHAKLIRRSFFSVRDVNAKVYSRKIISDNKYFYYGSAYEKMLQKNIPSKPKVFMLRVHRQKMFAFSEKLPFVIQMKRGYTSLSGLIKGNLFLKSISHIEWLLWCGS